MLKNRWKCSKFPLTRNTFRCRSGRAHNYCCFISTINFVRSVEKQIFFKSTRLKPKNLHKIVLFASHMKQIFNSFGIALHSIECEIFYIGNSNFSQSFYHQIIHFALTKYDARLCYFKHVKNTMLLHGCVHRYHGKS